MGILPKSEVLFAIENISERIIWWSRLVFDNLLDGKKNFDHEFERDILDTIRINTYILK